MDQILSSVKLNTIGVLQCDPFYRFVACPDGRVDHVSRQTCEETLVPRCVREDIVIPYHKFLYIRGLPI